MQAELIANGKAISGPIINVRELRNGRKKLPMWTIESDGTLPLHLRENDALCVVGLAGRQGRIRRIESVDGRYQIEIEITVWKNARGTGVPAASDRRLTGTVVTLVEPDYEGLATRRIQKLRVQ